MTFRNPEAAAKLARARAIVWDLDHTLYGVDDHILYAIKRGFATTALAHGAPLSLEAAMEMTYRSFAEHGSSWRLFQKEYGIPFEVFHFEGHEAIDESVIPRQEETAALIAAMPHRHALITHSSRAWTMRVLKQTGLSDLFSPDRIFVLEDYDFQHKHEHATSFTMALTALGCAADEAIMVEDSVRNLKIPHDMGMGTVLIHHGKEPDDLPDPVDAAFASVPAFIEALKKS